jgi:hypothetical protein
MTPTGGSHGNPHQRAKIHSEARIGWHGNARSISADRSQMRIGAGPDAISWAVVDLSGLLCVGQKPVNTSANDVAFGTGRELLC